MPADQDSSISCIMAVFNGSRFIEAAIDSLVRQSTPPREIVVVDDGSTDDSAVRAGRAGGGLVRIVSQSNRGVNIARSAGFKVATGSFIHFLDADDLCPPGAFQAMHDALVARPAWNAVFGRWCNFWIEELAAERDSAVAAALHGVKAAPLLTTGLFRRQLIEAHDPASTGDAWHGTVTWLASLHRDRETVGRIDALTLERRIHQDNMSRQKSPEQLADLALSLHRAARTRRAEDQE